MQDDGFFDDVELAHQSLRASGQQGRVSQGDAPDNLTPTGSCDEVQLQQRPPLDPIDDACADFLYQPQNQRSSSLHNTSSRHTRALQDATSRISNQQDATKISRGNPYLAELHSLTSMSC